MLTPSNKIIEGLNDAIRTIADYCEGQHDCEGCIFATWEQKPGYTRCNFRQTPEEWTVLPIYKYRVMCDEPEGDYCYSDHMSVEFTGTLYDTREEAEEELLRAQIHPAVTHAWIEEVED